MRSNLYIPNYFLIRHFPQEHAGSSDDGGASRIPSGEKSNQQCIFSPSIVGFEYVHLLDSSQFLTSIIDRVLILGPLIAADLLNLPEILASSSRVATMGYSANGTLQFDLFPYRLVSPYLASFDILQASSIFADFTHSRSISARCVISHLNTSLPIKVCTVDVLVLSSFRNYALTFGEVHLSIP